MAVVVSHRERKRQATPRIILGAGLYTRAIRKPAPGVAYFEIDDKNNILAFKKARLEGNGVDTNVRYIAGNYVSDGLIDLLKKSEFDFERPTHFIWEGNTMYLTAAAVSQVLGGITRHVTHFTVSLDYVTEEVIAKTTSDPEITVLSRGSQLWALLGLTVSVMSGVSQTTPRRRPWNTSRWRTFIGAYWATQPLDSPIYDYYSSCTLQAVEQ
jgi:methyltransferase (TIGR00027 family)